MKRVILLLCLVACGGETESEWFAVNFNGPGFCSELAELRCQRCGPADASCGDGVAEQCAQYLGAEEDTVWSVRNTDYDRCFESSTSRDCGGPLVSSECDAIRDFIQDRRDAYATAQGTVRARDICEGLALQYCPGCSDVFCRGDSCYDSECTDAVWVSCMDMFRGRLEDVTVLATQQAACNESVESLEITTCDVAVPAECAQLFGL